MKCIASLVSLLFLFLFATTAFARDDIAYWQPGEKTSGLAPLGVKNDGSDPLYALKRKVVGIPGEPWVDPVTGIEFVWIPPGCFDMGSNHGFPDEKPVRNICLDGFWISRSETTQAQWEQVLGSKPSLHGGKQYPVENVSWDDVQAYILALNGAGGVGYRLPFEAEWEYAARAGKSTSIKRDAMAWTRKDEVRYPQKAGAKEPSGVGLYDMFGNVWEWCADSYGKDGYSRTAAPRPGSVGEGKYRVRRGGSWNSPESWARPAIRSGVEPNFKDGATGFRLVRPVE